MNTSPLASGFEPYPTYRPAIQGLRAVAVLMVVAYHAGLPVPGGFVGVDVFFVISGFVITEMLHREWTATGTIDLVEFFRRRVRRLLPALALVIIVTLVLNAIIMAPLEQPARTALTGLGGLLLSANVVIALTTGDYFDAPAETNPLLHLWSLSVEEQFYLLLPVLLLLAWRRARRRGRRSPIGPILALSMVSFALLLAGSRIASATVIPTLAFGFYSPVTRTWEFMLGVLLALTGRWRSISTSARRSMGAGGILLLAASMFGIDPTMQFPGPVTMLPVVGTAMLIVATEDRAGQLHDLLTTRVLVAIGDRSYAWYLWHWPLIVFASTLVSGPGWSPWVAPLAAVLSIAPAWWSFRVIERPLRQRLAAPVRELTLRYFVAPVALATAMSVGAANAWYVPALADAEVQVSTRSVSQQAGCHGLFDELGPERFETCWFGGVSAGPPIYLLGDSNASSAADSVVPAGAALDRPIFVTTGPNCPPYVGLGDRLLEGCLELIEATYLWLASQRPGDVLLVATDSYWYLDGGIEIDDEAFEAAVRRTVDSVRASGHRPVIVTPIPAFRGLEAGVSNRTWSLTGCTLVGFYRANCGAAFTLTKDWPQQGLWRILSTVAAETGAEIVDLVPHVCPDGDCRTDRDGRWDYRDGIHLSARRSAELADVYRDVLEASRSAD